MALSTGTVLAGRYEITAPVAVGGMGEVWQARDQVLDRTVAAKVLRSEYTGDPHFLARFRNEARHTAALSHPNIASIYDYGETRDEIGQTVAFLVMEFVEGQPLVTILAEEGRLPVDWTLHVLGQAADGLSAAHRAGVVHRDIKPGNLMVRPDGVVKLTDFGIAQARDATPLTRTGMVVGTAQYLSPEQAQGMEVTAASDVYSLGVVGYECLAGMRPFDGTSQVAIALAHINRPPPPLPADVPPAVQALIGRALAKEPVDRFPDGGAFAGAVRQVQAGGTLPLGPVTGVGAGVATTEIMNAVDGESAEWGTRVLGTGALPASALTGTAAPLTGPRTAAGRTMPPLQGPPVDDDGFGHPGGEEPPRRSWRWAWALVALLLVLALGGGAYLLLSGNGKDPGGAGTTTTTATSAPTTAGTVFVDTSHYIGQDADAVAAALERQGLTTTQKAAPHSLLASLGRALDPHAVAGTDPANTAVPKGTNVVLYVARDGFTPGGAATQTSATQTTDDHGRSTATTTRATTTTAAPTTTTAPSTTPPTSTPPPTLSGSSAPTTTSPTPSGDNNAAGPPGSGDNP